MLNLYVFCTELLMRVKNLLEAQLAHVQGPSTQDHRSLFEGHPANACKLFSSGRLKCLHLLGVNACNWPTSFQTPPSFIFLFG